MLCFGLSGHAGKRPCLLWEGLRNKEFGKLSSLDYWYEKSSVENNSKKSNTQRCTNGTALCVRFFRVKTRILYIEKNPVILIHHLVPEFF